MTEYAERDPMALDEAGNYYCRHVSAMTKEGLHSKSAIAAELAHRDMEIDRLRARLAEIEGQEPVGYIDTVLDSYYTLEEWPVYVPEEDNLNGVYPVYIKGCGE